MEPGFLSLVCSVEGGLLSSLFVSVVELVCSVSVYIKANICTVVVCIVKCVKFELWVWM